MRKRHSFLLISLVSTLVVHCGGGREQDTASGARTQAFVERSSQFASTCNNALVDAALEKYRAETDRDAALTLHSWLCDPSSNAYLARMLQSIQYGKVDRDAKTVLHAALSATGLGTPIEAIPPTLSFPDQTLVTQWRNGFCCEFEPKELMHEFARVLGDFLPSGTDQTVLSVTRQCAIDQVTAQNRQSASIRRQLSCAAEEASDGAIQVYVGGFDLGNQLDRLDFSLSDNLSPAQTLPKVLLKNQILVLGYRRTDPRNSAKFAVKGVLNELGGISFSCDYGIPALVDSATRDQRHAKAFQVDYQQNAQCSNVLETNSHWTSNQGVTVSPDGSFSQTWTPTKLEHMPQAGTCQFACNTGASACHDGKARSCLTKVEDGSTNWSDYRICKSGQCADETRCLVRDQDCEPEREGQICGVEQKDWSACTYGESCAQVGTQSRQVITKKCQNQECVPVSQEDEPRTCTRSTEGISCKDTEIGSWGECQFADVCTKIGTHTRAIKQYACHAGACGQSASTVQESCARERDTQGDSCGPETVGSWSGCGQFVGECGASGSRVQVSSTNTCSQGVCVSGTRTETSACSRDTNGALCGGGSGRCSAQSCMPLERPCSSNAECFGDYFCSFKFYNGRRADPRNCGGDGNRGVCKRRPDTAFCAQYDTGTGYTGCNRKTYVDECGANADGTSIMDIWAS